MAKQPIRMNSRVVKYGIAAFILLILTAGNVYLVKTLAIFGSPLVFSAALLLELVLILAAVYTAVLALRRPLQVSGQVLVSAWQGIKHNPSVRHLITSRSPVISWLRQRLNPSRPYGLGLSLTILLGLYWLIDFVEITGQVVRGGPFSQIDVRVLNLVPSLRTPLQTEFFKFATFLGNWETLALVVLALSIILWRNRQRVAVGLVLLTIITGEASAFIVKHLVGRGRPNQALSLLPENGASFPSGHAILITIVVGLVAYFFFRSVRSHAAKLGAIISGLLVVFLVALSRLYLGVHFPTDVFGGVLFGLTLLTLAIGALEIHGRFGKSGRTRTTGLVIVPLAALLWAILAYPYFTQIHPNPIVQHTVPITNLNETTIRQLPLYSETLTEARMEPISFIYISDQDHIRVAFARAGWHEADPPTFANTLRALAVAFQGGQYLTAPVTPSFLAAKSQDFAFEQPTALGTLRQRHHTRLWRTAYTMPDGRPIWVATASFDEGVEVSATKLPTHRINPNIDAERQFIVNSLGVANPQYFQVTEPQLGKNASGDLFFTDGKAVVVSLGGQGLPKIKKKITLRNHWQGLAMFSREASAII